MEKIDFLGLKVDNITTEEILQYIAGNAVSGEKRIITYLNANCFNLSISNKEYGKIIRSFDMVYPDGKSIVWASRLLGPGLRKRVNAGDFFGQFCRRAREKGLGLYLLGGSEPVISRAVKNIKIEFPGLRILGAHNGYFDKKEEADIVGEINKCRPNVLIVGLGVLKQEKWIFENLDKLNVSLFWAVGGLFSLLAEELKRAPYWMRRAGLEWLYRLVQDPKRLWKRYLIGNVIFIFFIFKGLFKKRCGRRPPDDSRKKIGKCQ